MPSETVGEQGICLDAGPCHVAIHPSPRPVFIKEGQFEHLYIRTGNSTRLLTTKEAIDYCKTRWK